MSTSRDNESREIVNLERGQTILDALEHSEIRSQTEVKHKFLMLVMIAGLCVLAMYVLRREDSAQYKIISVATCIFCNAFLVYWGYLIATASQLHCIRLTTSRFQPFYGNMVFPTEIKHYPSRPIKSSSEMFALRGSSVHIFLVSMAMTISCFTAFAVMLNWLDLQRHAHLSDNGVNINYLEQALAICSALAFPLIACFELGANNPYMTFMHYFGVLCLACMVWPFAIQSGFSMLSIIIVSIAYISFGVWIGLGYYYPDDLSQMKVTDEEMQRKVHRMSVRCLLAQISGSYWCSVALCLYLWNIQEVICECSH